MVSRHLPSASFLNMPQATRVAAWPPPTPDVRAARGNQLEESAYDANADWRFRRLRSAKAPEATPDVNFLKLLRLGGPWLLIAGQPDVGPQEPSHSHHHE